MTKTDAQTVLDALEFYSSDNWSYTGYEHSETGKALLNMQCLEGGSIADNAIPAAQRLVEGYSASRGDEIASRIANAIHTYVRSDDLSKMEATKRATQKVMEIIHPMTVVPLPLDRNEIFKHLCKLGTPINMLIGAARSAKGLHEYHGVPKAWQDSLIAHAEEAKTAWDGIVALVENMLSQPPAKEKADE